MMNVTISFPPLFFYNVPKKASIDTAKKNDTHTNNVSDHSMI